LDVDGVPLTLQWRVEGEAVHAVVVPPPVASTWARQSAPIALVDPATVVLTDETGALISGVKPERGVRLVTRLANDTGLPWTVSVGPNSAIDLDEQAARGHLLSWGLGAIVLLLTGGSYLLWRVVQRELAVARIYSDFVAAVSHEFRTPLTALQHATELLQENDQGEERRQSMYGVFSRNTTRLRQLVESLLDFARMEDGRKPYELRPTDAVALVQQVTAEFRLQAAPAEANISIDVPTEARLMIDADPTAFSLALWNLLDNAVKYSPAPQTVAVAVESRLDRVVVAVRDLGYGIPPSERRDVFHKFVRGRDTQRRGIKDTGLGLAIVSRIVRAHGGQVELESEIERGSVFRLVLPASR
jgi:signal transduction histidine kinase